MTTVSPEFESILEKYKKHKIDSYKVAELLSDDYTFNDWGADTDGRRYGALVKCGTLLGFKKSTEQGKTVYHLKASNFCRMRLCPMCQFRKAEKMFANMVRVEQYLADDYRFLHMVLTIPNSRDGVELVTAIKILYRAFGYLISHGKPKKAFKGILRCLEISYNYDNDTFHPHLHCLVAVKPSYFNDPKVYISYDHLREAWTDAVRLTLPKIAGSDFARSEHLLQCSVRACKQGDYEGIAEVCKYCVKPLDLDKSGNDLQNKRVLLTLWHTLKGLRFVQKYGVIKQAFKDLNVSEEPEGMDASEGLRFFEWDSRYLDYKGD